MRRSPCAACPARTTTWWASASAVAVAALVSLAGCEAVPSLTFEGQGPGDAGYGMCPAAAPQNATCCGTGMLIACYGQYCTGTNCTTGCDKCAGTGMSCCGRSPTNANCVMDPSVCK
jgi:hypothetical protein